MKSDTGKEGKEKAKEILEQEEREPVIRNIYSLLFFLQSFEMILVYIFILVV